MRKKYKQSINESFGGVSDEILVASYTLFHFKIRATLGPLSSLLHHFVKMYISKLLSIYFKHEKIIDYARYTVIYWIFEMYRTYQIFNLLQLLARRKKHYSITKKLNRFDNNL